MIGAAGWAKPYAMGFSHRIREAIIARPSVRGLRLLSRHLHAHHHNGHDHCNQTNDDHGAPYQYTHCVETNPYSPYVPLCPYIYGFKML